MKYYYSLLLSLFAITNSFAQTPTPFDCSSGLGYIITNVDPGYGNISSLYSINLGAGNATLIKDGLLDAPNRFLNGFGYNINDNFLYGYRYNTNQIVKVGSNGGIQSFTVAGLGTNGQFATGDVSSTGIYYLYSTANRTIVSIDLNAPTLTAQTLLTLPANHFFSSGVNDWAVSPIDGNIYGITSNRVLFQYNVTTNTVTNLGTVNGLTGQSGSYGTAFMDSQGNLYIGNNTSGNIYKIATPHIPTSVITATLFSSSLAGRNPGDGARCPNQIIPPSANNDQACVPASNAPISITVAANDGAGSYPIVANTVRLINPSNNNEATTITIAGQGTFSVNTTTGVVSFSAVAGFTGTSIGYTIRDNQNNVSAQATLSVVPALSAPVVALTQPTCSTPGSITVTSPTSVSLNYSINGTTYQTSPVFSNVVPGIYAVTTRYTGGGCVSPPSSVTIIAPTPPAITPITGYATSLCSTPTSNTYAYTNATSGGTWSVTPTSLATINPTTGILTTVANTSGTAIITYSVTTGSSCTSTATQSVTISPTNCMPMPVSLISFAAQVQGNQTVSIEWQTSWERSNKGFLIDRTKDLKTFEQIHAISDVVGISNSLTTYRVIDDHPYRGTSYYRLRQIDQDGTIHSYPAKSVIIDGSYQVYPNPIGRNGFTLELDEPATAVLHLYTITGSELSIRKTDLTSNSLKIVPNATLSTGIYILTVDERGSTRQYRLVAQ